MMLGRLEEYQILSTAYILIFIELILVLDGLEKVDQDVFRPYRMCQSCYYWQLW